MLDRYPTLEQKGFVSDEINHKIAYISKNVRGKEKFTPLESFFEEDNKSQVTIDVACCRLHRH